MSKSTNRRVQSARRATSTPSTASANSRNGKPAGGNRTGNTAAKPPAAGLNRFRSRHPVMSALVPAVLVLVVIGTMVIVKVTGGSTAPAQAVSRLECREHGLGRWPRHHLPNARRCRGAHRARGCSRQRGEPVVRRLSERHRQQLDSPRCGRQAGRHLHRRRVLPVLCAERWGIAVALSRFGTFSNLSATHSASQRRLPRHADPVLLRVALLQPLSGLRARRGGDEPSGERLVRHVAAADRGGVQPAGPLRPSGEHPVPRHRQQVRGGRGELLASGPGGPVPVPDRRSSSPTRRARWRRPSTAPPTRSRPPSPR